MTIREWQQAVPTLVSEFVAATQRHVDVGDPEFIGKFLDRDEVGWTQQFLAYLKCNELTVILRRAKEGK